MNSTTNLNINITTNVRALLVIGATVYIAARMGTSKALKKGLAEKTGTIMR